MNAEHNKVNNEAKNILAYFDKNKSTWEGNIPLETAINNIRSYQQGVDDAAYEQVNKSPVGLTADKKQHRQLMVDLTLGVISKVRPFAKRINDNDLLHAIDYAETELTQVKEEICVNRCLNVLTKGREYFEQVRGYSLTENDLVALETSIEPFSGITEKRDIRLGERISATAKIEKLVPLIRSELKILDDLVKSQINNADFKATYFNLR